MKICMLAANDLINDPRVTRHAKSLANNGFDVTVLAVKTERAPTIEFRDGYRIQRIGTAIQEKIQHVVGAVKIERRTRYVPHSKQVGSPKPRGIFRRLSNSMIAFSAFLERNLQMARIARSVRADIYVSNDLDTLLAGVIASKRRGRLIYDSHELWTDQWQSMPHHLRSLYYTLEKSLIKKTGAVMTVNHFIAEELTRRYGIATPEVVLNCPDVLPTDLGAKPEKRQKKIALYQGRYVAGRGLETVIQACPYLERDVTVLFRGLGDQEHKLKELAANYNNCRFVDPVPMQDMVKAAAEADIGILAYLPTNLNNKYASPNKLFEYVQAGLPMVATDIPFLKEIILGEQIGLVFDGEDPRSIAHAINAATREPLLSEMKENVKNAAKKYTWQNEEKKLVQIYEALM